MRLASASIVYEFILSEMFKLPLRKSLYPLHNASTLLACASDTHARTHAHTHTHIVADCLVNIATGMLKNKDRMTVYRLRPEVSPLVFRRLLQRSVHSV